MYSVKTIGNINNGIYKNLINYIFETCDIIRITCDSRGFSKKERKELKKLERLLESKFASFIRYMKVNQNVKEGTYHKIYYIKLHEKLYKYLLERESLYDWLNPCLPTDLAFFKKGYCFLESVTHERLCWIYYQNESERNELKKIGLNYKTTKQNIEKEELEISQIYYYLEKMNSMLDSPF